jgi:signal transduction histidine kinase
MPRLLFYSFFLIYSCCLFGQNPAKQNVKEFIDQANSIQSPIEALVPLKKALEIEAAASDSLKAALYMEVGIVYGKMYVNDSANYFFNQSLKLSENHQDWSLLQATTLMALGNVSRQLSENEQAMEFYIDGLNTLEKNINRQSFLIQSQLLGNIGGIYYDFGDFDKSLEYAERGRDLSLKNDLTEKLGIDHLLVGYAARAAKQYDKALLNNEKALTYMLADKDSSYFSHLYYNIASLLQLKGEWQQALLNFDNAKKYAALFGEEEVKIMCLVAQAEIYLQLNNAPKAYKTATDAKQFAIENTLIARAIDAAEIQYKILKQSNRTEEALGVHEEYVMLKDSLYRIESKEKLEDISVKYESEKKQQEIELLKSEKEVNELQRQQDILIRYSLIAFALLLFMLAILAYKGYTNKIKSNLQLDQKNQELALLNIFKDRMFAVISHDLRNPVNAFSTIIESLHQNLEYASKEDLKEFLGSTLQSANDLKGLLTNLLEWSLVQIGQKPFHPQKYFITEIVKETIQHVSSLAIQKEIQIVNGDFQNEMVFADKSSVVIIIRNLLANAIKFSPARTSINILVEVASDTTSITVQDQGIGMSEADLLKLFKLEESTHSIGNSQEKGAGIGLLLCKELAEKNQGKIFATSILGKGSMFTLVLPNA